MSFRSTSFEGRYLLDEEGVEKSREVYFPEPRPQGGKGAEDQITGETAPFFTASNSKGKRLSSDPFSLSLKEGRNELLFKTAGENWRLDPSASFSFTSFIEAKGEAYALFGGAFGLDKKDLPPKNADFAYAWMSDVNIQEPPQEK